MDYVMFSCFLWVLLIFGICFEVIKMVLLVKVFDVEFVIEFIVCVIGQYKQMLVQVLELFVIEVDYSFDVMVLDQMFNGFFVCFFVGIDQLLEQIWFDCVLVYGDIIIVMVVVMVVFYWCILVGYVEVGLCIYDMYQFWLEEMNWCIIDVVSDLMFVFIVQLCCNFEVENLQGKIVVIGNIVIDVLQMMVVCIDVDVGFCVQLDVVLLLLLFECCLLLVIGYWCENFGIGFLQICCVLVQLV